MSGDEKPTPTAMERYREDVKTIREILVSVERVPLYENWVFHAWGALLIAGSVIDYFAVTRLGFSHHRDFLLVWLPVLIIAGGLELASYLRNVMIRKLPFFSRAFMRVFAGLTGSVGVLALAIIILSNAGVLGGRAVHTV